MSDEITLADLRCVCGSDQIAAVFPGEAPSRRGAVDLFTRLDPVVTVGEPTIARCMARLCRRFSGVRDVGILG